MQHGWCRRVHIQIYKYNLACRCMGPAAPQKMAIRRLPRLRLNSRQRRQPKTLRRCISVSYVSNNPPPSFVGGIISFTDLPPKQLLQMPTCSVWQRRESNTSAQPTSSLQSNRRRRQPGGCGRPASRRAPACGVPARRQSPRQMLRALPWPPPRPLQQRAAAPHSTWCRRLPSRRLRPRFPASYPAARLSWSTRKTAAPAARRMRRQAWAALSAAAARQLMCAVCGPLPSPRMHLTSPPAAGVARARYSVSILHLVCTASPGSRSSTCGRTC